MSNWLYAAIGYGLTAVILGAYVYSVKRKARRLATRGNDIVQHNGHK